MSKKIIQELKSEKWEMAQEIERLRLTLLVAFNKRRVSDGFCYLQRKTKRADKRK